jgi:hypothetical protein
MPGSPPILWGQGDQLDALSNGRPLFTATDSPAAFVGVWYNGPAHLSDFDGYLNPANSQFNDLVWSQGRCVHLIVWLAEGMPTDTTNRDYAITPTFYNTDLAQMIRVVRGNGPNYGPIYLTLFTELETMHAGTQWTDPYWGNLKTAYLNACKTARQTHDQVYVSLGFGGYGWATTPGATRSLSFWDDAIAQSDFLATQNMTPASQITSHYIPQLENAASQFATYGMPWAVSHTKMYAPGSVDTGMTTLVDYLTNDKLVQLRNQGLFLWNWMDDEYLNDNDLSNQATIAVATQRMRDWASHDPSFPPTSADHLHTANQQGIETDASGWLQNWYNANKARSTAQARDGAASLAVSAAATQTGMGIRTDHDQTTRLVAPGQRVLGSLHVRAAATARPVRATISFWDAAGSWITEVQPATLVTDATTGWVRAVVSGVAPPGTNRAALGFEVPGSVTAGETHYVDRAHLWIDDPDAAYLAPAPATTGDSWFDGILRPMLQVFAGFGGTLDPGPTYIHLGVGPGLGTGLLAGPGVGVNEVDITGDVRSVTLTQRGASSDIDTAEPVTCTLVLNNFRGDYDPSNTLSPWVGQLVDGTPIRVRWTWQDVAYDRFYGELVDVVHEVANDWDITATFTCLDGMEKLGRAYLPQTTPTRDGDRSGARIGYLADQAAQPTALRALDAGSTILPPTVLGASALELMHAAEQTEFGLLFVSGSGVLTFYDRHHGATATRSTTVQATFGDAEGGSGGGDTYSDTYSSGAAPAVAIPLRDIALARTRDRTFNRVAITRDPIPNPEPGDPVGDEEPGESPDEPVEQVADDPASQGVRGVLGFPAQIGQLSRSDFDALALAQYLVDRFSVTQNRISGLNVSTLSCPTTLYAALLGLGPLDRVAVDQDYGPATITTQLLIQGVTESVQADPPAWELQFSTSPPPPAPGLFVLGTSQLGSGTLGW